MNIIFELIIGFIELCIVMVFGAILFSIVLSTFKAGSAVATFGIVEYLVIFGIVTVLVLVAKNFLSEWYKGNKA